MITTGIKLWVHTPEQAKKALKICKDAGAFGFMVHFNVDDYDTITSIFVRAEGSGITKHRATTYFDDHSFKEVDIEYFIAHKGKCSNIPEEKVKPHLIHCTASMYKKVLILLDKHKGA